MEGLPLRRSTEGFRRPGEHCHGKLLLLPLLLSLLLLFLVPLVLPLLFETLQLLSDAALPLFLPQLLLCCGC